MQQTLRLPNTAGKAQGSFSRCLDLGPSEVTHTHTHTHTHECYIHVSQQFGEGNFPMSPMLLMAHLRKNWAADDEMNRVHAWAWIIQTLCWGKEIISTLEIRWVTCSNVCSNHKG
jgi:hypothetical protein